jgi:hypothetical protein
MFFLKPQYGQRAPNTKPTIYCGAGEISNQAARAFAVTAQPCSGSDK